MIYPKLLQNLIDYLKKLPGIGEKSAERMALALIKMSADEINDLSNCLILAKKGLKKCTICGSLTEDNICYICAHLTRKFNVRISRVQRRTITPGFMIPSHMLFHYQPHL